MSKKMPEKKALAQRIWKLLCVPSKSLAIVDTVDQKKIATAAKIYAFFKIAPQK